MNPGESASAPLNIPKSIRSVLLFSAQMFQLWLSQCAALSALWLSAFNFSPTMSESSNYQQVHQAVTSSQRCHQICLLGNLKTLFVTFNNTLLTPQKINHTCTYIHSNLPPPSVYCETDLRNVWQEAGWALHSSNEVPTLNLQRCFPHMDFGM